MKNFMHLGSLLSREEQKNIKGGIGCAFQVNQSNGSYVYFSGQCSGSTVEQCNSYAQQNCSSIYYAGGTSVTGCHWTCA